jgi:hypothetical protein
MSIARDILAASGAAAVLYGAALIHPAMGWVVGGGGVLGLAVWWSWRARK